MKKLLIAAIIFNSFVSFSQTYFFEDFNYNSFSELKANFKDNIKGTFWSTKHADDEVDISEDGKSNLEEHFKKTTIITDPLDSSNKVIRFEFNKVDPYFYAKYSCDDDENNNVIDDITLESHYNKEKNLYCIDCNDSPLKIAKYEWKTHLNRNEIAIQGPKRKLYKPNKDHWFGLNMMIDDEYQLDSLNNGEIVTQFHIKGRDVINPPVALLVVKNRFKLALIKNNDGKSEVFDLGPVVKGKWITWKYHIALSNKDKKGLIEVWRDDQKIVDVKGKNAFKKYRMYLKLGVYKWGWWDCNVVLSNTNKKVLYFDKVWANKLDSPYN